MQAAAESGLLYLLYMLPGQKQCLPSCVVLNWENLHADFTDSSLEHITLQLILSQFQ